MSSSKPSQEQQQEQTQYALSLAILDDYQCIAAEIFNPPPSAALPPIPIATTAFPQTLNPSSPADLATLISRLHPFPIISTMRERTPFPATLLEQLPNLKLLLTTGMRNASIDLEAATRAGVVVVGTTGKGSSIKGAEKKEEEGPGTEIETIVKGGFDNTTQHTFALLLGLCGRIAALDQHLKHSPSATTTAGGSMSAPPAAWQQGFMLPLAGRTLGVLGLGRLGARAARTAIMGFGMRVLTWSSSLTQDRADEVCAAHGLPAGAIQAVGKEELFRRADVVSVHYVLSERSRGLVGREELLRWMKPGAVLVNTARGPLVDEQALLEALRAGRIRGAALDVFWSEPLDERSIWRTEKWGVEGRGEVLLSPHMGYVEEGTLRGWYNEQVESVEHWVKGEELLNQLN